MKRAASIEALLRKAATDFTELRASYESSLHEKNISEDFRVLIKNIIENLRSCLDYMAHEVFESKCATAKKPDRLYFPIRSSEAEFNQAATKDFPGLEQSAAVAYAVLEQIQPYRDPWLGQFNKLNNHNKHQDLVEQTRTESRQVTVSREDGSVSWGPSVTFGSGVSVMGVPIDPRTQMPVQNAIATTNVVVWVDFRFSEIDQAVLPFVEASIKRVTQLFEDLRTLV